MTALGLVLVGGGALLVWTGIAGHDLRAVVAGAFGGDRFAGRDFASERERAQGLRDFRSGERTIGGAPKPPAPTDPPDPTMPGVQP